MDDIDAIFKSYDIRGLYPEQIDRDTCFLIGQAFSTFLEEEGELPLGGKILVAFDMRPSCAELVEAFIDGCGGRIDAGPEVISLGLCSTDMLYFASGQISAPGVIFTASHNPAEYNGMKLCKSNAVPIGEGSGLERIRSLAKKREREIENPDPFRDVNHGIIREEVQTINVLEDFVNHALGFIDARNLKTLKVIADTANGMGGLVVPAVFKQIPLSVDILYGELDGTFPNHPADPLNPENLFDLKEKVLEASADVGLAFDGDADRVFLIDELGVTLSGSTTTAIVANGILDKEPSASIIHNLICSKSVEETVLAKGGKPIRSRVGHSHIKKLMAETGAAFAGEHSGHYYFRDNFCADSGIIAALVVLEQMSLHEIPLSQLRKKFEIYSSTGEINFTIENPTGLLDFIANKFSDQQQDELDGLTVASEHWWFNLRSSNTEPLIRLNLETRDEPMLSKQLDLIKELIADFQSSAGN